MKKNKIFMSVLLSVATLCGVNCSGFLEENNIASQSAEAYFATASGYESLMTGAYNTLKSVYNSTTYYSLTQLGTDLSTQNNGSTTNQLNQYTPDYLNDNGTVFGQWRILYSALKDVNAVIGRADAVITKEQDSRDGMDKALVEQHVAEAKFLRALYLFEIVKNWGQGPLLLEESVSASTESQLNSGAEFYKQILMDLTDVINSALPWKQNGSNYGRASKAAAMHLRSLVYLTRAYQQYSESGDFKNALADAENVINNSGHKLLADYALVHRQANEENDEIIFPVNFSAGSGWNNNIWSMFYLFVYREGWNDIGFSGIYRCDWATVMPSKYTYLLFDWKKDHRAEVTFMSPFNGNPLTSIEGEDTGKNWFQSTKGIQVPIGSPVIYFPLPVEAEYKQYTEAEKVESSAKGLFYYNYPTGSIAEKSYQNVENDDYYITGYQSMNSSSRAWLPVWKFKDHNTIYQSSGTVGQGMRDIYLFRLAETYLIAAEAAVGAKDNAKALTYINAVRSRAANGAQEAGLPLYSGTVTLDNVLDERGLELFGEAPRWNDLTRTGKLAERVLAYNWDVTHITGGLIKTQLSPSTNAKYSVRPIPKAWLASLTNGEELGNNPGWE
ncbi:MAG: RagB/SusD family nutrient uptake outer membrane protein [Candidatus Cryptobacteroides sp.]|jgi:hypothetical protein